MGNKEAMGRAVLSIQRFAVLGNEGAHALIEPDVWHETVVLLYL